MESESSDVGDEVEDDAFEDETKTTTTATTTTLTTTSDIAFEEIASDYENVLHPIGNETHIFDI